MLSVVGMTTLWILYGLSVVFEREDTSLTLDTLDSWLERERRLGNLPPYADGLDFAPPAFEEALLYFFVQKLLTGH
jgi:hypothetical protein